MTKQSPLNASRSLEENDTMFVGSPLSVAIISAGPSLLNSISANNAFGAKVLNVCTAIVDIDGNIYVLKLNE